MTIPRLFQVLKLRRHLARAPQAPRACPICARSEPVLLTRGDREFIGVHTSQCPGCGFVFSSPQFPADVLNEFYRTQYRSLFKGHADPAEYRRKRPHLGDRAEFYARLLAERRLVPAWGTVVDIGAGEGTLLELLRERFPALQLIGVEPGQDYREHVARAGIPMVSDVRELPTSLGARLALSMHVLEHVDDPLTLLEEARRRLGPDGTLVVDVPDVARYSSLVDLHVAHCNHFSAHTLQLLLERAGYEVLEMVPHRPVSLPLSLLAIARPAEARAPLTRDPDADRVAETIRAIPTGRLRFLVADVRRRLAPRSGR